MRKEVKCVPYEMVKQLIQTYEEREMFSKGSRHYTERTQNIKIQKATLNAIANLERYIVRGI